VVIVKFISLKLTQQIVCQIFYVAAWSYVATNRKHLTLVLYYKNGMDSHYLALCIKTNYIISCPLTVNLLTMQYIL